MYAKESHISVHEGYRGPTAVVANPAISAADMLKMTMIITRVVMLHIW